MRARLALKSAGIETELREILLRDKPDEFLATSQKGTVPVLQAEAEIIDESLDIMRWALERHDPDGWLDMPEEGHDLIAEADGPFKTALDRYKYNTRYGSDRETERAAASDFLRRLDARLSGQNWLFGASPKMADMAILTFVRQFANTDRAWFDAQPWANLRRWLDAFLDSDQFQEIMRKVPVWVQNEQETIHFL